MLYKKAKKEALVIHKNAVDKYNAAYQKMDKIGNALYTKRCNCVLLIQRIEVFISSIANSPKEFEKQLSEIQTERQKFRETDSYAAEAMKTTVRSGVSIAAGIAGGAAVATTAPTAAMWVATTFGTASTGTAISALHGAAATKAALAWLGGGALSAGGAGIAGGNALLALAGPIGWGIAGATTVLSAVATGNKNKKVATAAIEEARKVTIAGAEINETTAKIQQLFDETAMLFRALADMAASNQSLKGADYLTLTEDEQYRLGTMVNNTLSLAALLNRTV